MKTTTFFSVVLLFLSMVLTSLAQTPDRETLLKYVSNGNAGTEFWVSFPPSYEEVAGAENTTRLFVASPVRQPVTVEVPGKGFSMTKMAVANDVVEFKLPTAIGQAYSKPTQGKAPPEKVYGKCGVHITALSPIVVYGMTRFQYTSDGFLAIPISKLGTEYIIAAYPQYTATGTSIKLPSLSNIVAAYDNTKVTFTMGGNGGAKTTGGLTAGQTSTWNLNAGDVVCFANDDDNQDISGSHVLADKPIGIVSGNQCANIPNRVTACDFIDEMELPITAWGKEYHITPIAERLYNPIIRIFAHPAYKDVKVYRDGKEWLILPNNTRTENQSFVERRVYDGPPRSTVISADAPIYVMLYNTGQADDNVSSDPFQLVLTPVEHYQKEITFATPNAKGGTLPFTRNFVNIVYALNEENKIPEDLEFATVKNGEFEWRTLISRFGAGPGQLFTKKSENGEQYAMKRVQLPGDGVYRIRAKKPFAAYAYGFSDYDSYGFPTSASVLDASIIDTTNPGIIVSNTSKYVWSGYAEDSYTRKVGTKSDEIAGDNNGIIASVCLLAENSGNLDLKVEKTEVYKSLPVNWTLSVVHTLKQAHGILVASDNFGNYTYKEFNYLPTGVASYRKNTGTLECNVSLSEEKTDTLILQNVNHENDAEILDCSISDNVNFKIDISNIIGRVIRKNEKIEIPITFLPKVIGNYFATFKITTKAQDSSKVEIFGTANEVALTADQGIYFDSTVIENVNNSINRISLLSLPGNYKVPATIVDVRCVPESGVAFEKSMYGSEGFQMDKSLFVNKTIDSKVSYRIDVPVKFKAVKEGLHKATVFLYLTKDKSVQSIELIGYGKKETISTVEDENSSYDIRVFTNITNKEIVVQSKSLSKMKEYSIINQIGEVSLSGSVHNNTETLTIPIQNLPIGMYIFTTEINGKKVQEKFVVMR